MKKFQDSLALVFFGISTGGFSIAFGLHILTYFDFYAEMFTVFLHAALLIFIPAVFLSSARLRNNLSENNSKFLLFSSLPKAILIVGGILFVNILWNFEIINFRTIAIKHFNKEFFHDIFTKETFPVSDSAFRAFNILTLRGFSSIWIFIYFCTSSILGNAFFEKSDEEK